MRHALKIVLALGVIAAAGCSTDVAAPQNEFNGVRYTAAVNEIISPSGRSSSPSS